MSLPVSRDGKQVSDGYYSIGSASRVDEIPARVAGKTDEGAPVTSQTAEVLCEPGFWCEAGVRHPCEAGSFGDAFGATGSTCSGYCSPGFVCREGSVSPRQEPCGVSKKTRRAGIVQRQSRRGANEGHMPRNGREHSLIIVMIIIVIIMIIEVVIIIIIRLLLFFS